MERLTLAGYVDWLVVAPGERVRTMVSCAAPRYRAALLRLSPGDGDVLVEATFAGSYAGGWQPLLPGSYMEADDPSDRDPGLGASLCVWTWPTTPSEGRQVLLARESSDGNRLSLAIEHGRPTVTTDDGTQVVCPTPLSPRTWHLVAAAIDARAGEVRLSVRSASGHRELERGAMADPLTASGPTKYLVSAESAPDGMRHHFNGKLEAPSVYARPLDEAELDGLAAGQAPTAGLIAAWDFSSAISTGRVTDVSGTGVDGRLVNMPTRGVVGHAFTGNEVDWRHARHEYAAVHFHDDDLDDAGWDPAFTWQVPDDMPSGVYAIHLTAADGAEDRVPVVVRPARGRATADIAVVLPTFTYLAYANEHQLASADIRAVFEGLGADFRYPLQPSDAYILEQGLTSLYDKHSDGSGVCYASHLRPLMTVRPDYRFPFLRQGRGGPHGLPADLQLLTWLDRRGVAVDVLTDHDLHVEGADLLRAYRTVISGTHHEYWSKAMLDGLAGYLARGGRFMYLSGNGLYWVTALDTEGEHTIEVRRTNGTRTWDAAPGEWHLSTTGELGGLWRFRGDAPQRYVGVGFTAEGLGEGRPYHRTPASHDPRAAFIFEGVGDDAAIGDFPSPVLGWGAAGWEVDRFDAELGSPPHALVVASATGFSDEYQHVVEEVLHQDSLQGGTQSALVRADMVFFETPSGGAVFSVGSIGWCGSLLAAGGDNSVARVTGNVLDRFRDPGEFTMANLQTKSGI